MFGTKETRGNHVKRVVTSEMMWVLALHCTLILL